MTDASTKFSAADLEPGPEEKRAARADAADRVAAALAVLAAGVIVGGMVALGACAAPFVFRLTPPPFNGDAMAAAFARFDRIAIALSALLLACEVVRTFVGGRRGRTLGARARRLSGVLLAMAVAYVATTLTPRIAELHKGGASRGVGDAGQELDRVHKRAEAVGKAEVGLAVALVLLHVLTLRARRPADDDDLDAPAPAPPGPFGAA
jgi:hypothetical protein